LLAPFNFMLGLLSLVYAAGQAPFQGRGRQYAVLASCLVASYRWPVEQIGVLAVMAVETVVMFAGA
jgi:hypothetical protein